MKKRIFPVNLRFVLYRPINSVLFNLLCVLIFQNAGSQLLFQRVFVLFCFVFKHPVKLGNLIWAKRNSLSYKSESMAHTTYGDGARQNWNKKTFFFKPKGQNLQAEYLAEAKDASCSNPHSRPNRSRQERRREFSSPELTLCADSYSVSVSPPWHVKAIVARKRSRSFCLQCR